MNRAHGPSALAHVRSFVLPLGATIGVSGAIFAFVVAGPYAHVRNPMISGVATILAGEAAAAGSWTLAAWAVAFVAGNHAYFVLSEEPGLRMRFGAEYGEYARHVPRWIPRVRAWSPVRA